MKAREKAHLIQKDISWLHVTVNNASRVDIKQTTKNLIENVSDMIDFKKLVTVKYFV